jgi:hypothetical protein
MAHKLTHEHHDLLGYIPSPRSIEGAPEIGVDGLRSTGEASGRGEPPILAVGDSFTYGDEVRALEAWPAQLQKLLGRRVLNGGVTGYGLDQIVLRAEQLAAKYTPCIVLVGFIADDIKRTEWRRLWSHGKPWFDIVDGRLELRDVPVAAPRHWLPVRHLARLEAALTCCRNRSTRCSAFMRGRILPGREMPSVASWSSGSSNCNERAVPV